MSKVRLIITPEYHTIFRSYYLKDIWTEYFDIQEDVGQSPDNRTIYIGPPYESNWIKEKRYHKTALDTTWEYHRPDDYHCVASENWFWYNESLWYKSLGYDNYTSNCNFTHLAFMPINIVKPWRTSLVERLGTRLDKFIWSYRDKVLPDDIDKTNDLWQRYFNPVWYDTTEFSVVVETDLTSPRFVTEKTFKALAFKHPFVVFGSVGNLALLKDNGFETFDDIFDESYDAELVIDKRISKVIENIDEYSGRTTLTQKKLEHNFNKFYDTEIIKRRIKEEIVFPLLEYAET